MPAKSDRSLGELNVNPLEADPCSLVIAFGRTQHQVVVFWMVVCLDVDVSDRRVAEWLERWHWLTQSENTSPRS